MCNQQNGFFSKIKFSCARFFASNQSKYVEIAGIFLALVCDSLTLWQVIISNNNQKRDIALSVAPTACLFIGMLFACCFANGERRNEPVGSSAISFLSTTSYLILRSALDLSLALFVTDYNKPDDCYKTEEIMINAAECGTELVYLLYALFEGAITRSLDGCLSRSLQENPDYPYAANYMGLGNG